MRMLVMSLPWLLLGFLKVLWTAWDYLSPHQFPDSTTILTTARTSSSPSSTARYPSLVAMTPTVSLHPSATYHPTVALRTTAVPPLVATLATQNTSEHPLWVLGSGSLVVQQRTVQPCFSLPGDTRRGDNRTCGRQACSALQ